MEFGWTAEQVALRAAARAFAAEAVATYGYHPDGWLTGYSRRLSQDLAARGWIGMSWPVEFGGGGRPPVDRLVVAEELIRAGAPIGASWVADRQMGPALIMFGTDAQRHRYLPLIKSGETTWCIGMSEPDAGSDLASLRTSAERDGNAYVITGRKIWTSIAARADFCYLICRTSRGARPVDGISELIVPMDANGISVTPIRDAVGDEHFCEVTFDAVRVPAENLVGEEGKAFSQTMRQLEHERGGIDRLVSNWGLYRHAKALADTQDPLTRQEIARLETTYLLGRFLVLREAIGQAPSSFSAATKCMCTEHEQRVADFASRILGADAMLWTDAARGIAYAPSYTIMGGTSNVMRNIVAERVLQLPKEPR